MFHSETESTTVGRPAADPDTKERLLRTAEQLVAAEGFDRVSVRDITARAGANVAAVNYHFGSREGLMEALLARHINPVNADRIRYLEEAESEHAPGTVPLRRILRCFLQPMFDRVTAGGLPERLFFKMLGRCLSERGYRLPPPVLRQVEEMSGRYAQALRRVLPGLAEDLLMWRMNFTFGTVAASLAQADNMPALTGGRSKPVPQAEMVERLVDFCAAGLSAPESTNPSSGRNPAGA